jgi:hypothetical protein
MCNLIRKDIFKNKFCLYIYKGRMEKINKRREILYNKTDFNRHLICQLPCIFKCCKCKRNNTIVVTTETLSQHCLFCGTPNYVKR